MKQQSLIEVPQSAAAKFVNVVIPPLRGELTYAVSHELESQLTLGVEVAIPLGKRIATGWVVNANSAALSDIDCKFVTQVVWPYPLFNQQQLELFNRVSDYYGAPLSQTLEAALPPRVPQKFSKFISRAQGFTELPPIKGKVERAVWTLLSEAEHPVAYNQITSQVKGAANALKGLKEKGLVVIDERELVDHFINQEHAPNWAITEVTLNEPQQVALEKIVHGIEARQFSTHLPHGVTGSGKTEVYIEAVRKAVELNRGALVIVPEIALTPQLLDRFHARLGSRIAVLHSALQPRVRWDSWRALLEKRALIGIGARSGVFAPLQDPGIIIVDEEHDSSYKQAEGLRYNARDLAILRGKLSGCPVILGSATPSLESFFHASQKKYSYISLPSRPKTSSHITLEVVDLNHVKPWEMASRHISPQLHAKLAETIERKEQAFILYNRRGFARYFQCERCENVVECPNCSVTLTYHQTKHKLMCHYCGLEVVPPSFCTQCSGSSSRDDASYDSASRTPAKLVQHGAGTEKVFEELTTLFPNAAIERLDRDAVSDVQVYRGILSRLRSGETSILVGTQMIAKGHDLPSVTLVGIVDCDIGLHMPDFRASERVFQLLTQASGRAGRGSRAGAVVLQTRVPKHPSIVHTLHSDYQGYALQELETRKNLHYPPFTRMMRIIVSAVERELPLHLLHRFRDILTQWAAANGTALTILGPTEAPLERIKARWRAHLLIKSERPTVLNQVLRLLSETKGIPAQVRVAYDMDPQDML